MVIKKNLNINMSLSSLKKIIRSKKAVMIGDSKIDEQFAKNLKVKYIKFTTS